MSLRNTRRRMLSGVMMALCGLSVVLALIPLAYIFFFVISQGFSSLDLAFFTQLPKPHGETGGGMANAIVGSLEVSALGAAFAIPVGLMAGVFCAENARSTLASIVRFSADTLNGIPSIVIGLFAYAIVVVPMGGFSALAGGVALGMMMIPLIARTTEELLRMVPNSLREGALALGATHGRAVFTVVIPAALPGILTGVMLAFARVAGETAPLLFTALGDNYWSTSLTEPISTLTVQIYKYANSPYEDLHRQAWAGALVLVAIVFSCSLVARFATRRLERMQMGK